MNENYIVRLAANSHNTLLWILFGGFVLFGGFGMRQNINYWLKPTMCGNIHLHFLLWGLKL